MRLFPLLLLAACSPSFSASMEVSDSIGNVIIISEEKGPVCLSPARHALFLSKNGLRIPGCWVAHQGNVFISFLDGDRATIPQGVFRPSKEA